MEASLGIDFGTTNIRVAHQERGKDPRSLPIGLGVPYLPSVVALKRRHNGPPSIYRVGEDAARLADSEEVMVIENLKRCLTYRIQPYDAANLPHWWDRESRTVRAWGCCVDPLELAAAVVNGALRAAARAAGIFGIDLTEEQIGDLPTTVGCPAYSGYEVHHMMAEIMHRAGNKGLGIGAVVEEPNLTSVAFARWRELPSSVSGDDDPERPRIVLIYDLGGGTFDTAVVEVRRPGGIPNLTVLGADCLPFTGGMDIDQALLDQVLEKIGESMGVSADVLGGLKDWERNLLLRRVREAKEQLTEAALHGRSEARLVVEDLAGKPVDIPVTREDIRAVLNKTGIVDHTLECCLRAYRRARMYLDRHDPGGFFMGVREDGVVGESILKIGLDDMARGVDHVILVGGSTKIPDLREQLLARFGEEKVAPADGFLDPIAANSLGAAMSRDRYLPRVLTRSPYWIHLACGETRTELYRPFDPYLEYDFSKGFGVEKLSQRPVDLSDTDSAAVVIRHCDDDREKELWNPVETRGECDAMFAFDRYGTVHLCSPHGGATHPHCSEDDILWQEDHPPWQHEYQLHMLEALREDERRKEEEEKKRRDETLSRPAHLDVN